MSIISCFVVSVMSHSCIEQFTLSVDNHGQPISNTCTCKTHCVVFKTRFQKSSPTKVLYVVFEYKVHLQNDKTSPLLRVCLLSIFEIVWQLKTAHSRDILQQRNCYIYYVFITTLVPIAGYVHIGCSNLSNQKLNITNWSFQLVVVIGARIPKSPYLWSMT